MGKKKNNPYEIFESNDAADIWKKRDKLRDQAMLNSLHVKSPEIFNCVLDLSHSIALYLDKPGDYKKIVYEIARSVGYSIDRLERSYEPGNENY